MEEPIDAHEYSHKGIDEDPPESIEEREAHIRNCGYYHPHTDKVLESDSATQVPDGCHPQRIREEVQGVDQTYFESRNIELFLELGLRVRPALTQTVQACVGEESQEEDQVLLFLLSHLIDIKLLLYMLGVLLCPYQKYYLILLIKYPLQGYCSYYRNEQIIIISIR